MSHIPLHNFVYRAGNPLPFMIGRLEELPAAARAAYPNRHTFYEIFWITQGAGVHQIDFVGYPIRPQTLYFIAPGQIHLWQLDRPMAGFAMLIPSEFFPGTGPAHTLLDDLSIFRVGESPPALGLEGPEAAAMGLLVETIAAEYAHEGFAQLPALQALVQLLLIRAQRLLLPQTPAAPQTAAARLTRAFVRLTEIHYRTWHGVAPYAAQLGVTAGHLTDTVRATMGVSAGAVIHRRLALEAQRLLAHSDASVAGIAHQLHFSDPSYFGRFFRRETGQAPESFRTAFRKMYQKHRD